MSNNFSHVSKTMDKLANTVSVTIAQLHRQTSPTKVVETRGLDEEDCIEVSPDNGDSAKETPSRRFSSTRYPDSASEANVESPRGFIGQENVAKTGVTTNSHVTSQSTKEITDNTFIKGDAQMHATMDPVAFQTIMEQTLRHQVGIIEQTLSH